jgi:prepilin-type N-terminal cleavage/methylation domain-containing protein
MYYNVKQAIVIKIGRRFFSYLTVSNMFRSNSQKGFTLIELLVVIAIIGILSSVVIVSLNNSRKKGRDTKRVQDISSLRTALEFYYDEYGEYPSTTTALAPAYIPVVPADPGSGNPAYAYAQLSSGSSYHIGATLETSGHSSLDSDVDSDDGFNGSAGSCDASTGTDMCYDMKP